MHSRLFTGICSFIQIHPKPFDFNDFAKHTKTETKIDRFFIQWPFVHLFILFRSCSQILWVLVISNYPGNLFCILKRFENFNRKLLNVVNKFDLLHSFMSALSHWLWGKIFAKTFLLWRLAFIWNNKCLALVHIRYTIFNIIGNNSRK